MTFTTAELHFLASWVREVLANEWQGPAQNLKKAHPGSGAELGTLAAARGEVNQKPQVAIADLPAAGQPTWPWTSEEQFRSRVDEAERLLTERRQRRDPAGR